MDLLNYDSSDSEEANGAPAVAAASRKRARDGGSSSTQAAGPKALRQHAGASAAAAATAAATVAAGPTAPPFTPLDAEAQSATAAARRAANALFERRVGARQGEGASAPSGGAGSSSSSSSSSAEAFKPPPLACALAAPRAAVALDPSRALDARTLGLLDARSRKELGLSEAGQWAPQQQQQQAHAGLQQPLQQQLWGLPAAPAGGIVEVSGRQVRGSAWEVAHLEAMAASAAAAAAGGGGRRAAAAPIAATMWSHATGRAEVSTGGATRAQKSKHQINTLAAAAVTHNLRAADRAAEASMQAALARAGGGSR